jgi:hypothetical protein
MILGLEAQQRFDRVYADKKTKEEKDNNKK